MSLVIPHRAVEAVAAASDPKKAILDFVGDLSGIDVIGDRVLIATYIRPGKTKGGLHLPDSVKQEDVWQGKVGLVLKWGPDAFVDHDSGLLYDQVIDVGEWGVYFVGDAKAVTVKGFPCRLVRDTNFCMKVKDPESVL